MTKAELESKLNTTDTYTMHMEDGKSLFGTIADMTESWMHIKQINGETRQIINEVLIPMNKISAIVIELPAVKADAPIDV
jgi:hypothetical protein